MEVDATRLEALLDKLLEVEPKLDGLTAALEKMIREEVDRQLKERDGSA